MYYSSGNYEAFATPKKPEGIDGKSAYVVGTGLAGLAAACFLIRDAQMPGEHITLFEHLARSRWLLRRHLRCDQGLHHARRP